MRSSPAARPPTTGRGPVVAGLGPPSDRSAVIVRARLPSGLGRLRRASVDDAAAGVPAHLTLLYPFVEPPALTPAVRRALVEVAGRHRSFGYRLDRVATWPDTLYVAVDPARPFVDLQRDLQSAFPEHPIYGRDSSFRFVPHVTIAKGAAVAHRRLHDDPAWSTLPRPVRADAIEVIAAGDDGRWRLVWRIRLGAARRPAVDRMRP